MGEELVMLGGAGMMLSPILVGGNGTWPQQEMTLCLGTLRYIRRG